MQLYGVCPSCNKSTVFNRIHRSFIEKVFRKKYFKYECVNCSAEVFSHQTQIDIVLHRNGRLNEQ